MTSHYEVRGAVAVIRLDNPPVNELNWKTSRSIIENFDRAAADPTVEAVVLTGADFVFSAGADIREFAGADLPRAPTLHDLLQTVESSPKPVVAAINRLALGGGFELALASNYRIASSATEVGLPEVKLGLLPGGGGTQRLPRAVGLEKALSMIVSGETVRAQEFDGTRLFDRIADSDALPSAPEIAGELHTGLKSSPRLEDQPVIHPNAELARTAAAATEGSRQAVAAAREQRLCSNYPPKLPTFPWREFLFDQTTQYQ